MNRISTKVKYLLATVAVTMAMSMTALATEADFQQLSQPIIDLVDAALWYVLGIVTAVGAIFCIFLGVKFAKAEDPQEHEKAKKALKNAIIGFLIIFILILALKIMTPNMRNWVSNNTPVETTTSATK